MAITSIVSSTRMTFNTALGMAQTPLDVPRGRVSLFIAVGVAILESGKEREGEEGREKEMNELRHVKYTKEATCQVSN